VTINWKVGYSGTPSSSAQSSLSIAASSSQTFSLTAASFNFGDTLYVWTSAPNGGTDGNSTNDLIKVLVPLRLGGTITIGGTKPVFPDLATAINALNTYGVCTGTPVTFNIRQGTYYGSYTINAFTNAGSTNAVVFQPDPANTLPVILTYAPGGTGDNFVVRFNGINLYTTFKNITMTNTNTVLPYGAVICFSGTAASSYAKVLNCTLNGRVDPSVMGATSTNDAVIFHTSTYAATYDSIIGCTLNNDFYGIYWSGNTSYEIGNGFKNNTINNFYSYGIYAAYQQPTYIYGNTMNSKGQYSTEYGIYGNYDKPNGTTGVFNLANNTINLSATSTSYGIYLNYFYVQTAISASPQVYNNKINISY
jgi:hypothetical protein